jgi:hypothetical protein
MLLAKHVSEPKGLLTLMLRSNRVVIISGYAEDDIKPNLGVLDELRKTSHIPNRDFSLAV